MSERLRILFRPRIEHEHDMFIAYCDEFQLAASDYSQEEAILKLRNTVRAFCTALRRSGKLDNALKESGVQHSQIDIADGMEIVDP